jgi:hypothetical protein
MIATRSFGRHQLAWVILFGSFFLCLLLSVTAPVAVTAFLQNATQPLDVVVQANQGTVGVNEQNGPRRAVLAGEPPEEVGAEATIQTDTTASALLRVTPPDGTEPLAVMQVSGNSTVQLVEAAAPRFQLSGQPHRLSVNVQSGRLRIDVLPGAAHPLELTVTTPQGRADVSQSGRYTFEVNGDTTQVTVHDEGAAVVANEDKTLTLDPGQRAEIPTEGPLVGPLDPARDLIQNGNFSQGLDDWALFAWQVELPDQPKGETTVTSADGDPVLRFAREGVGHADVRTTQSIGQDVSGYDSLRLSATLRILNQSLGVCGVQGSECPLFIIVNYIDDSGVSRVWQHGFFAEGVVDDNLTPGACISCAVVQRPHERVPLGQFYFYDVNLIDELASQGFLPPRHIESVTLVGSGHTFTTEVSDVALVVE